MANVADNRNLFTLQFSKFLFNGEHVKKSLRWMFVSAIARIQNDCIRMIRDELGNTCPLVTDHDNIDLHRFNIAKRVEKSFALLHT